MGQTASNGRERPAVTSSSTASVTAEINVGNNSTSYNVHTSSGMSRVYIPLAYSARILSSQPARRRSGWGIRNGSNVPSRSRGVTISNRPDSPGTVFDE